MLAECKKGFFFISGVYERNRLALLLVSGFTIIPNGSTRYFQPIVHNTSTYQMSPCIRGRYLLLYLPNIIIALSIWYAMRLVRARMGRCRSPRRTRPACGRQAIWESLFSCIDKSLFRWLCSSHCTRFSHIFFARIQHPHTEWQCRRVFHVATSAGRIGRRCHSIAAQGKASPGVWVRVRYSTGQYTTCITYSTGQACSSRETTLSRWIDHHTRLRREVAVFCVICDQISNFFLIVVVTTLLATLLGFCWFLSLYLSRAGQILS